MANLTKCISCDSCNSKCNVCESCNSCESCNDCERICEISTNVLSSYCGNTFCWESVCIVAGQTIGVGYFDKAQWDKICTFINQRASIGSIEKGGSSFANSSTSNVKPFKYSEFSRVQSALGTTSGAGQNKLIKGSYFQNLVTAANKYRFSSSACDSCNTGCQSCNNGNADPCTSGQKCDSGNTEEYCCSCDVTCESDTPPATT